MTRIYLSIILVSCLLACSKKPKPEPVAQPIASVPPLKPAPHRVKTVQFAFDSDTVKARDISRITKDCLNYPGPRILTGYASKERSGKYTEKASKAYNLALSARRANNVALAYTLAGCTGSQVAYFGETARYKTLEQNRRVTVE